jgi:hypothetical protein
VRASTSSLRREESAAALAKPVHIGCGGQHGERGAICQLTEAARLVARQGKLDVRTEMRASEVLSAEGMWF